MRYISPFCWKVNRGMKRLSDTGSEWQGLDLNLGSGAPGLILFITVVTDWWFSHNGSPLGTCYKSRFESHSDLLNQNLLG